MKFDARLARGHGRQRDKAACEALHLAEVTGATLLIAKLDRLLRKAAFLLTLLRETISRNVDRRAEDLRPVVDDIRADGATSLRIIAAELDNRGILPVAAEVGASRRC